MNHCATLNNVRDQISTHDCPSCGGPTVCAMEMGHSGSLCWCMYVEPTGKPDVDADKCLCKRCLAKDAETPQTPG